NGKACNAPAQGEQAFYSALCGSPQHLFHATHFIFEQIYGADITVFLRRCYKNVTKSMIND
ncbi:MAG: hypothetical protein LBT94_03240, partial [Prevotellaceae bacterium]|nr:hypothetical protein [Prevotellaceae bacterium]